MLYIEFAHARQSPCEHDSALAESRTSYCTIKGTDEGSLSRLPFPCDHGVGSTDHFSALKIWMFENKFVSLLSHLKTIEPMEVHRGAGTMCNTKTSKVISRTDPMICCYKRKNDPPTFSGESSAKVARKKRRSKLFRPFFRDYFLLLHKTQKLCIAFLYRVGICKEIK